MKLFGWLRRSTKEDDGTVAANPGFVTIDDLIEAMTDFEWSEALQDHGLAHPIDNQIGSCHAD